MPFTEVSCQLKAHQPRQGLRPASRSETNGRFLFFSSFFLFQSGICFRCRLDNSRRFPNFQLPTIGVTADFYILHFLDNRRCSYTLNFVQRKHNFCCKWTCLYTYIQGLARRQTSLGPSKYFGIKYLFSFLHPYSKGDMHICKS